MCTHSVWFLFLFSKSRLTCSVHFESSRQLGGGRGRMAGGSSSVRVRWLSDLDKTVLVSNFDRRGWAKGSSEGKYLPVIRGS